MRNLSLCLWPFNPSRNTAALCGAPRQRTLRSQVLYEAELVPHHTITLLSCSPHEPQASPHPCLDVTGAPYSPHSVQILVAAGEHHTHGLMAFPDLGHGFLIHKLSLALVFHSLKSRHQWRNNNRAEWYRKGRSFLWPRWELILEYREMKYRLPCRLFQNLFEMEMLNFLQFQLFYFFFFY